MNEAETRAELIDPKLPKLLDLKYGSLTDAADRLGGVGEVRSLFMGFQKHLYEPQASAQQSP